MGLKRNLKTIFDRTDGTKRFRFLARALGSGPGWAVWDQKKDRFLKSKEVARLTEDQVNEAWSN